ncbi:uncharacterized protein LOC130589463 [Beta vulgaris subsp. vulgaris]|uniref:uncharacterized protein LOC130589463 n=1 Tax=Beta vulgaris subsp. vulgaris TaxID=3555 RepID=UPI0025490236|nr:uncharacterized protein LOC130589463 [Beta vulgaris subsp. vulgaris]
MHEHYKKVGGYLEALKASSPGTTLDLVTDPTHKKFPPIFQRLCTCFEGLQKGWRVGCRRVICVDGCFLKTFLRGQLLCAVGRDGNDQMYPIAWAIVESENNLSWEWFLLHLQKCLELGDGNGVAIISDEHQSLSKHIFALWHKVYKGDELKILFWKIAKAYNMADFSDAFAELEKLNPAAATAFKDIRAALMQRLVLKRQEMQKATSKLCPKIQLKLEGEKTKAANCDVFPSTETLFNVNYYLDQLVVDLEAMTCTCRKWEMLGIPCCHAIACIYFLHREAEDYVDQWYTRDVYHQAYAGSIPPCEGERHWPRPEFHLDPPPMKIGPGRTG